jgi:hypothetical protein
MVRSAALALVSALALAACGQGGQQAANGTSNSAAAPGSVSSVFPNLNAASYRSEGQMIPEHGDPLNVVMVRSGQKMRMEMNRPEGQMVNISDLQTHEAYAIITQGGHTTAMRIDLTGTAAADPVATWQSQGTSMTPSGPCSAAGENGSSWTRAAEGDQPAMSACVTSDGILLWTKEGDRTNWETTSVQRGPQDPAQFVVPPGVQVMDLGNVSARAAAMAAAAAKNGH